MKCPFCKKPKAAKILYGLVVNMDSIQEQLDNKEIVLGGCCVTGADPKWECNSCYYRW